MQCRQMWLKGKCKSQFSAKSVCPSRSVVISVSSTDAHMIWAKGTQENWIMFPCELFHWPSKTVLFNLLVLIVLFFDVVSCEHRVTVYRRGHLQNLYRPSCSNRNDCPDNSFCHNSQRKCVCKQDYIEVQKFVNHSYVSHQKMTCLPIARLDDRCVSTDQVRLNNFTYRQLAALFIIILIFSFPSLPLINTVRHWLQCLSAYYASCGRC